MNRQRICLGISVNIALCDSLLTLLYRDRYCIKYCPECLQNSCGHSCSLEDEPCSLDTGVTHPQNLIKLLTSTLIMYMSSSITIHAHDEPTKNKLNPQYVGCSDQHFCIVVCNYILFQFLDNVTIPRNLNQVHLPLT